MTNLNVIKTVWTGVAGAPYYTTLHHEPTIGAPLQDCVDAWFDFLTSTSLFLTDELTITINPEVTVIESSTGELVATEAVTSDLVFGQDSQTALPRQTQMLVRWSTAAIVGGRRRRGRTFIPGWCEDTNEPGGIVQEAVRANEQAFANGVVDAWEGAMVIYSPTHRSFSPVTGASVWNQWASLRSRRD